MQRNHKYKNQNHALQTVMICHSIIDSRIMPVKILRSLQKEISLDAQWYYKELVCFLLTSTFQNVRTILPDCSVSPQKVVILKLSDDFIVIFQTTSKTAS
jgi:CRISPR/Cas system CMR-associated protein Cmr3 (group 5 of RAMP superfamily)